MVSVEADVLGGRPDNPEPLLGSIEGDVQGDPSLLSRLAHRARPESRRTSDTLMEVP